VPLLAQFKKVAGRYLLLATLTIIAEKLISPFTPPARIFGLKPQPPVFLAVLGVIVALCILAAEVVKKVFCRSAEF
jgi:hypothetical protein